MHVADGGPVDALCGFFDVSFRGSDENPADIDVKLTTAPDPTGVCGCVCVCALMSMVPTSCRKHTPLAFLPTACAQ